MNTLNKTKPFGTVHGGENGACFEQDGVIFDAQGNPFNIDEIITEVAVSTSKLRKNEPDKPA